MEMGLGGMGWGPEALGIQGSPLPLESWIWHCKICSDCFYFLVCFLSRLKFRYFLCQFKCCTSGKIGKKRKKWRKCAFAARARVLVPVKMHGFLFLPHCFRLRIKMWVTAGHAEIGAKPHVTIATTFREFLLQGTWCWMLRAGRGDSVYCNLLGCGSVNVLDPDPQEHGYNGW